ncbi:hypothetical protein [Halorubrum sp. DM2]|uniref:hypothetical protein n=1 Tax=Halorubrum sp. DM2 TaxID=2527867 RepID=UPI0024B731F3|nr:hypothetical protein [Halorubrum sp. DM2]
MLQRNLTFGSINDLPHKEKGTFGEVLSGTYLKSQIRENPTLTVGSNIDDSDPRVWISHVNGPTVVQKITFNDDSHTNKTDSERVQWKPDFSFEVTLPDHKIRQRIFIETKTGDSRPEGSQLAAMKLAAEQVNPESTTGLSQPTTPDKRVVILCQVKYNKSDTSLNYERFKGK